MRSTEDPDIKGDLWNIIFLTFLYVLQYIPRGLSLAIPFILQKRKSTFVDQAEFSFASYSYCFKLLWAPLVDCVYWKKMGRRKTWLLPTQYLLGALLLLISMNINDWLGSEDGSHKPKVRLLAITFFACSFVACTQDIAVDGWSLTILQKRNVGYAGTCNLIGYVIGQFLGYVLFIILDSKDFCNRFRSQPQDHGFIGFADFILIWSVVFFLSTTLILILKTDRGNDNIDENYEDRRDGLKEIYQRLWKILKIGPVRMICFIFLTCEIGFGPVNGVVRLKLVEAGISQDDIAVLTIPSLVLILILPFFASRYFTGHGSMRTFIVSYILKLILGIMYATMIIMASSIKDENDGMLPSWFYWISIFVYNFDNLIDHAMLITVGAFFCRVSDPKFGGIYLTLFNTMSNIGHSWPISLSLSLVDPLTIKTNGLVIDGFYIEIILCTFIGFVWLCWGKRELDKLENEEVFPWKTKSKRAPKDALL